MQQRNNRVAECEIGDSRTATPRVRRASILILVLGVVLLLSLVSDLAPGLAHPPPQGTNLATVSVYLPLVSGNYTSPIGFTEYFSTVTYQDADKTTADWDTAAGKLQLHSQISVDEVASLPSARDKTSAVYVPSRNKAYVFGGTSGSAKLDEIVQYDLSTNAATVLEAKLPTPRTGSSAVYAPTTNKAYIFGGDQGYYDVLDDIVEYDFNTDSVSVLGTKLPSPRMHTSAIYVASSNKAYIFGGDAGYGDPDPGLTIVEFDLSTSTVTLLDETLPSERYNAPAVYVESQNAAYLFGGRGSTGIGAQIVKYDLGTGTVTLLDDSLPSPRWGASAVYVPGESKAYVLGGYYGATLDDIVEYDLATGSTALLAEALPTAVSTASDIFVPLSNRAYVFGGYYETLVGQVGVQWEHVRGITEIGFSHYADQEQAQSTNVNPSIHEIKEATLTANQVLNGQSLEYYLSNNGGADWEAVDTGVKHTFAATGSDLRWRAILRSDGSATPVVDDLSVAAWPDTDVPLPAAPGLSRIANGDADGSFQVTWSKVDRAAYYVLEQASNSGFSDASVIYSGPGTSTMVTGRRPGTYHYRVKAVNATGSGAWSNSVSVSVTRCLGAPALAKIENGDGDGKYVVEWSGVETAVSYSLQEDTSSSFPGPASFTVNTTSKSITGQKKGTYYYRVKAANEACESSWSNVRSVEVTVEAPVPQPGTWYGDTSWFEDVRFRVASDSASVSDVRLVLHDGCGEVTSAGPVPIENGHFSFGWFWGDFTAADEAEGNYAFAGETPSCGFVLETGVWDASR